MKFAGVFVCIFFFNCEIFVLHVSYLQIVLVSSSVFLLDPLVDLVITWGIINSRLLCDTGRAIQYVLIICTVFQPHEAK